MSPKSIPAQDKNTLKDLFNNHTYEGQRGLTRPVPDSVMEGVFKFVEHLDWSGLVLDAGCGRGGFIRALKRHGINSIVGIDMSNRSLLEARDTGAGLANADIESLPFKGETFDVTLFKSVIYYLPDPAQVLQEVARVLRRDGIFIALEPNPSLFIRLSTSTQRILARFIPLEMLKSPYKTIHSIKTYRTLLERNGFTNIQIVPVDMPTLTLKDELVEFLRHPKNLSYLILFGRTLLEKLFKVLPRSQRCNNIKISATKGGLM